ncbi:MAG: hypothetical protein ABSG91_03000 [Syntrophobacteraceae bacterium]|jgi:hypothetical protein
MERRRDVFAPRRPKQSFWTGLTGLTGLTEKEWKGGGMFQALRNIKIAGLNQFRAKRLFQPRAARG